MKNRPGRASVRGGLAGIIVLAAVALAVPPDAPATTAAGRIPFGNTPAWGSRSALQGRAAPDERMDLRFHLQLRDREAALAEAEAVTDPDSPRYGQFLTTEQFRARYAPTSENAATVRSWV